MDLHSLSTFIRREWKTLLSLSLCAMTLAIVSVPLDAVASFYNGPGIGPGVGEASSVAGISQLDLKTIIIDTVRIVLSFLALVAVIVIIIAGIILVTSQGDDSKKDNAKKAILYAIVGLIVILLSEAVVNLFINDVPNGGILGGTNGVVGNQDIRSTVISIVHAVLRYMALVAVIVIVIAGIILITSQGDDSKRDTVKKTILYAIIGLIIILLAEAIVNVFVDEVDNGAILGDTGGVVGDRDLRQTVLDILFTVLSFLALVAVIVIVIAGMRLIFSQGDEGQKDTAKKTILYAVIGLIVILLASAIVWVFSEGVLQ